MLIRIFIHPDAIIYKIHTIFANVITSSRENFFPLATLSFALGFLAMSVGLVVCPSRKPNKERSSLVSPGSPLSKNIFVFRFAGLIIGYCLFYHKFKGR